MNNIFLIIDNIFLIIVCLLMLIDLDVYVCLLIVFMNNNIVVVHVVKFYEKLM